MTYLEFPAEVLQDIEGAVGQVELIVPKQNGERRQTTDDRRQKEERREKREGKGK